MDEIFVENACYDDSVKELLDCLSHHMNNFLQLLSQDSSNAIDAHNTSNNKWDRQDPDYGQDPDWD